MNKSIVESIRILPNAKSTFSTEEEFRCFIEKTMVSRGGYYYFPNVMMKCPKNTLVLFQYDGMIRATGILVDFCKESVIDEKGVQYSGYYKFDITTLHYLIKPITREMLRAVYRGFVSFSQAKQRIPLGYLNDVYSLLQNVDAYYC